MTPRSLRSWHWLHKWSSLVCTVFMLLVCLTGLPLIFTHEISELTGRDPSVPVLAEPRPELTLKQLETIALSNASPGYPHRYLVRDNEQPIWAMLFINPVDEEDIREVYLDARTGQIVQHQYQEDLIWVLWHLHVELFAGEFGMLFLGLMGLLLVIAIISGVVLYTPFMRKLPFGTVRTERARPVRWLDWHNLLGIITTCWLLVVAFTGIINTLTNQMGEYWERNELARMTSSYQGLPAVSRPVSAQFAFDEAKRLMPDYRVSAIVYPSLENNNPHHFIVMAEGPPPLKQHLSHIVLVDAKTGVASNQSELPWYLKALFLSKPLHFGDYGGMPLKILWAVLDLMAIVVLGSGLYLWWRKHRQARSVVAETPATVSVQEGV